MSQQTTFDLELSVVIAARLNMPGLMLQSDGPLQVCHSNVRFGWKVTNPQGNALFTGTNFGEVGPDGRLKKWVGFTDVPAAV